MATIMMIKGRKVINDARKVQNEKGVEKHSDIASQYSPQQSSHIIVGYLTSLTAISTTVITSFTTIVHF